MTSPAAETSFFDALAAAPAERLYGRRPTARRCIDPSLTVGGPLGLDGMSRLAWEGFSTVLDIRRETPGHRLLAQEAEAAEARKVGLVYVRQTLTPEDAGLEDVGALIDQIRAQTRPLFMFCDTGEAALMLGLIASDRFSSANEVFTRMSVWGSPLYNSDLSKLARAWYVVHGFEPKLPRSVAAYD